MYSSFKDNICGADPADMQLISKHNKKSRFSLWFFDVWVNMRRGCPFKRPKEVWQLLMIFKK